MKYQKNYTKQGLETPIFAPNVVMEELSDQPGEARLLSAVLQNGLDGYIEVEGIVSDDTFTDEINQLLWKCIRNFFEIESEKPTFYTIIKYADALGHKDIFEKKEEKDYVKTLFKLPVELQDCKIIGSQLKKLQIKRDLWNKLELAKQDLLEISTLEPLSKIVGTVDLTNYVINLNNFGDEGKYLGDISELHVLNLFANPNTVRGIATDYARYDKMIGGSFEPGTFHVIVARSGVGKSMHAANVAINVARKGQHVILADLELDEHMTINRLLAAISGVEGSKFNSSSFSEIEKEKIIEAEKELRNLPIYYINVACKQLDETISIFKRILNKKVGKKPNGEFNDCLIIYDYLRLNDGSDINQNTKEYQALGFQAIKLKNTAIQTKVPILTYIQANRDGIDKEDSSVASGSDRILWVCDTMSILKRKTDDEIIEDRAKGLDFNRKMVWIKARNAEEALSGEYINYKLTKSCRLIEGSSNFEIRQPQFLNVTDKDKDVEF